MNVKILHFTSFFKFILSAWIGLKIANRKSRLGQKIEVTNQIQVPDRAERRIFQFTVRAEEQIVLVPVRAEEIKAPVITDEMENPDSDSDSDDNYKVFKQFYMLL